ncbi:MAG: hypothetical protein D5S00_10595 [Tindallia sp. MSAO_Bac2]|nr:MAG: hypothetical protein D5S00_10595 [Tindallia sp. MSAO_Bac2]
MNNRFVCVISLITGFILTLMSLVTVEALEDNRISVNSNYESYTNNQFEMRQKTISIPQEGRFYVRKISFMNNDGIYFTEFMVPGEEGTLTYVDEAGKLIEMPLKEGVQPEGRALFLETESYAYLLGQGYVYKDLGKGTIESVHQTPISIKQVDGGWMVQYRYKMIKDAFGILWGVGSEHQLVNFESETERKVWEKRDFDYFARIGYEGYYYQSPSTYSPTSDNSYWLIPSAYMAHHNIRKGQGRLDTILGNALLHLSMEQLGDNQYLPTLPESSWLKQDYDISAGFFDTRFNADMMLTFLEGYRKYGIPAYRQSYLRLADYYMKHGSSRHFEVSRDENDVRVLNNKMPFRTIELSEASAGFPEDTKGWLVWDYADKNTERVTHVSLNHHAFAAHVFFQLFLEEQDARYLEFAEYKLNGIILTTDIWIKDNNNLEYALLPSGNMGFIDYDYLTYNDLFLLQNSVKEVYGARGKSLDVLMENKMKWMLNNSVHDFME